MTIVDASRISSRVRRATLEFAEYLDCRKESAKRDTMQTRYLEDFRPGQTIELGSRQVDRDEIIEFARKYDPQPFHVDEEAGRRSIYGGLIASGWHTVAML